MTTQEALVVEFDTGDTEVPVKIEITEDMEPTQLELEKGDTIRFREHILTVPQAGIYMVHAHGVYELARREETGERG